MIQEVITYVILLATILFVAYKLYRSFSKPKSKCDDCASNSNDCALHDLKQEIEKKKDCT